MRWLAFPKMTLSLMLAAFAALALIGINELGHRQSKRALIEIADAQRVRGVLNVLLQSVLDAETGQRGYLLTGEPRYREPYDAAARQIDGHLRALAAIFANQPLQATRVTELSAHVAKRMAELDMSIRLRAGGDENVWKSVVSTDVGRQEMASVRTITSDMLASSNLALEQGQAQIATSLRVNRLAIAVVTLAALAAFALYLRQTQALQRVGERQQQALQRERNALEDEVRERTATLAELATHLQQVRESERGFLARELHDELGSLLTAAKLDVARLKSRLADAPDAAQRLQHLNELLNSGIALKRRIIEDLRPSSLSNLGLIASLEILGREFAERSGMEIEMVLEPVSLKEAEQLTIYRMVQESLTNLSKYSQATEVDIVMKNYGNHVIVEVSDNGVGFDTHHARPASHGLTGMRHRVETAGGKLTVSSTPGKGTKLSAMLPSIDT